TPRQFRLRNPLCNPDLSDERSDLIEPLYMRQSQRAGLQLVVLPQFVFELPDHALVAATYRRGTLAWLLLLHLRECLSETLDLGQSPISLRVAFDHNRAALTT